ncbi:hypothetical protein [Frankia tisae]|uniref:hypothetical protein n=1 Tax=Frankia tisae TaxID=2950104 RepID=UPI0021BDF16F|nr:hypothetical protein [Frankia tisae]
MKNHAISRLADLLVRRLRSRDACLRPGRRQAAERRAAPLRKLPVLGLVVVASLIAGLAPNIPVLLVGRVLQRVGAAIAGPTALALFTTAVYGLVHAADAGWSDTWTIVTLAAAVVLFAALPVVDSRSTEPLLPGRVFAHRDRLDGVVNLLLLATVLGSFLFFLAQYLHTVLDLSPIKSGLGLLPFAARPSCSPLSSSRSTPGRSISRSAASPD